MACNIKLLTITHSNHKARSIRTIVIWPTFSQTPAFLAKLKYCHNIKNHKLGFHEKKIFQAAFQVVVSASGNISNKIRFCCIERSGNPNLLSANWFSYLVFSMVKKSDPSNLFIFLTDWLFNSRNPRLILPSTSPR